MNKTLSIIAISVLAVTALAQGGGQRGGFGGGQRGGFGGAMVQTETTLLNRNDVQKELKLTDEQKTKLVALRQEMMDKMRAQFQGGRNSGGDANGQAGTRGGFDQEAMRKQAEEFQKESTEKTKAILTEDQWKRLAQIRVQMAGSRIFTEEEFTKKLGLKAAQKLQITDMMDKQQAANQQIMAKFREEGADREALMKDLAENDKILREAIEKILTDEQRKTLADMEGPKFTPDPNERANFGGRGGGGNGGAGRGGSTGGGGGF
jgi:Spy/CpxP family protein refolding chaperone